MSVAAADCTFDALLDQLAAKHRSDIQAAISALSVENQELRRQLAELQATAVEQPASAREVVAPVVGLYDKQTDGFSRTSSQSVARTNTMHNGLERTNTLATRDVMERKMDQINKHEATKMLRRLQRILCEEGFHGDIRFQPLSPEKVLDALKKKGAHSYTLESVTKLLVELEEVAVRFLPRERRTNRKESKELAASLEKNGKCCISLDDLVQVFMMRDIEQTIGEQMAAQLLKLKSILVAEDLFEIIERLAALPEFHSENGVETQLAERLRQINVMHKESIREMPGRLSLILNSVVGVCVLLSIVFIGVSLDNDPDHPVWWWVEIFFLVVFITEVILKLYYLGWRQYLLGPDCSFNWLDLIITLFAAGDLTLSTFFSTSEASAFNGAMVLRSLRLFRFARLMKLFNNSPMLKNLASMMSGFLIGAPSLMWILVIILMFIYIMAIGFRSFFSVKSGYHQLTPRELTDKCGQGDFVELDIHGTPVDPACILHLIYAHEFFGTVPRSMITVFRFMMGDTSTTGGKSLVQALDTTHQKGEDGSPNVAVPFYFFYIPFMTIVIFGIFNIITAIFVETTINGLKHSDNQSRRKRYYESHYVQGKLQELVHHIRGLGIEQEEGADIAIDETTFHELMNNHTVKVLLGDLDVVMDETNCQFDMFDPEAIGQITLPHFLGTLLRLRGEPHKIDLVSSWSSVRTLQKNFHEFEQVALTTLQELIIEQGNIGQRLEDVCVFVGGAAQCPTGTDDLKELEHTRSQMPTPPTDLCSAPMLSSRRENLA